MLKTRQSQIRSLSVRFSPEHTIDWHAHSWSQLVYATEGVLTVSTENAQWLVPRGQAIWLASLQRHSVQTHGRVFMQTIYTELGPDDLGLAPTEVVEVSPLLHELIRDICARGIIPPDSPENCNLIRFVHDQLRKLEPVPRSIPMPSDSRARSLANRLLSDPGNSSGLTALAQGCGASLRTLQRTFKKELGLSIQAWRGQARMLEAARLLANDAPVTEVALRLGYESPSAFISVFRKHFGVTPGRFRQ